jgi:hypothetical protein
VKGYVPLSKKRPDGMKGGMVALFATGWLFDLEKGRAVRRA